MIFLCNFTQALDSCETLMTSIYVTKQIAHEHNGQRLRLTCVGQVEIAKCEGACTSQVSPSVVHFPGFKKVSNSNLFLYYCVLA